MLHPLGPVIALDIDGTTGNWHEGFRRFAEQYTGRRLEYDWKDEHEGKVYKALGLSKAKYRQIKVAYRQSGLKRAMPVFVGSRELTVRLRKEGAQIWICTTRPYLKYDNIDPDTRAFLRRTKIQFDGLIYGERKYRDLVQIVGKERIVCVVEDLPEMIEGANRLGLRSVLMHRPHNSWFLRKHPLSSDSPPPWTTAAWGAPQAADDASALLRLWKEEHV